MILHHGHAQILSGAGFFIIVGQRSKNGFLMFFSMLFKTSSSPLCQRLMIRRSRPASMPKPARASSRRSSVQSEGTLASATSRIMRAI